MPKYNKYIHLAGATARIFDIKKKKWGIKRGRANREKRERERGRGKEVRKKEKKPQDHRATQEGEKEYEKGFLAQKLPVGKKKENTDQTRPNPT